jgi:phage terminase large subunit
MNGQQHYERELAHIAALQAELETADEAARARALSTADPLVAAKTLAAIWYKREGYEPPHRLLLNALRATSDDAERARLLEAADPATRALAIEAAKLKLTYEFDFTAPDYAWIEFERRVLTEKLRRDPKMLAAFKLWYSDHLDDFVEDFGTLYEPRNTARRQSTTIPFLMFDRQRECFNYQVRKIREEADGLIEKSRDCGMTCLATALSAAGAIFWPKSAWGFGATKEARVDAGADPSTIFYKIRHFLDGVPADLFLPQGYSTKHMQIHLNHNCSAIVGDSGDDNFRGSRFAAVFLDEYAHIERPEKIDAAVSAATDTVIRMSSVNGNNRFADIRNSGQVEVFTFHYSSDPRKDAAWKKKKEASLDPVVWNSEYELDYASSRENTLISMESVKAAIALGGMLDELRDKYNLDLRSGPRRAALDIAGGGVDRNALCIRQGMYLEHIETQRSTSKLHLAVAWAFRVIDELGGVKEMIYDAVGLGGAVDSDADFVNATRLTRIRAVAFKGSEKPVGGNKLAEGTSQKAIDYFWNRKSEALWHLRYCLSQSLRCVNGLDYDAAAVIAINPKMKELQQLVNELTGAYTIVDTNSGKLRIDKYGDGKSPNCGDAMAYCYAPQKVSMNFMGALLKAAQEGAPRY